MIRHGAVLFLNCRTVFFFYSVSRPLSARNGMKPMKKPKNTLFTDNRFFEWSVYFKKRVVFYK